MGLSTFSASDQQVPALQRLHIPNTCRAVLGAGHQPAVLRGESQGGHGADVAQQRGLTFALSGAPDLNAPIGRSGEDLRPKVSERKGEAIESS